MFIRIILSLLIVSTIGRAEINECFVDVYYANGIKTIETKAYISLEQIKENVLRTQFKNDPLLMSKRLHFNVSYNQTQGFILDMLESARQKMGNEWGWEDFLDVLSIGFIDILDHFLDIFPHDTDLSRQVAAYKKSIEDGHGVIVIAHSQGNLFTNEAYAQIEASEQDKWMTDYFHMISVATPADHVSGNGPYITFDNDPILGIPDNLEKSPVTNPNRVPENKGAIGVFGHYVEFHAFSYYMSTDISKSVILSFIDASTKEHLTAPSQWKLSGPDTTCLSGKMVEMKNHVNDTLPKLENVYYEKAGKICSLNGTHVFGDCESVEDDEDLTQNVTAKDGFITVGLDWNYLTVDMDLEFDAGIKDIDDIDGLGQEHYYVASESDIGPGNHGIHVTHETNSDEELECLVEVPMTLLLNVKSPGGNELFALDITEEDTLDIGYVADLYVSETNLPQVLIPNSSGGSIGGSTDERSSRFISVSRSIAVSGPTRIYELIPRLEQALFGPLGGASIKVSPAFDANQTAPLYTGTTTYGGSSITTGLLAFPRDVRDGLDDEFLYLFEVSGGEDIDADDDLKPDAEPTINNGTSHAILSGVQIKAGGFKVSILTEIAYQLSKYLLEQNASVSDVQTRLDEVAVRLIARDVNDDGKIDVGDLNTWTPYFNKSKLTVDYDEELAPIVEKIYTGEDIYPDVYRLIFGRLDIEQTVYDEEQGAFEMILDPETDVTLLENMQVTLVDDSGERLGGIMSIDGLTMTFTPEEILPEDGKSYILDIDLGLLDEQQVHIESELSETVVIVDTTPPLFTSAVEAVLDENKISVLQLAAMDSGGNVSMTVSGGSDAAHFMVDQDNRLFFLHMPDFETPVDVDGNNLYDVIISAMDSAGNSSEQSMRVEVLDVTEPLNIESTNLSIDENVTVGTQVGRVVFTGDGDSALAFEIEGETLRIDSEGRLYLAQALSYEYPYNDFSDRVFVYDQSGQLVYSNVRTTLNDIDESLPEIRPMTVSVAENTPSGSVIGEMFVYGGLNDVATVSLSGEGADDFEVDAEGRIRLSVATQVYHLTRPVYHLKAVASNSAGRSDVVELIIYVNAWTHENGIGEVLSADVVIDGNGDIYSIGHTWGTYPGQTSSGMADGIVLKFDKSGKQLWTRQFGTSLGDYARAAVCDDEDNLYIFGESYGSLPGFSNSGSADIFLMKYSSEGTLLWQRQYGTNGDDSASSVKIDDLGDVYLLGRTNSTFAGVQNHGKHDVFLMHLDVDGDLFWTRQYGGSGYDHTSDLSIDSEGNALFVVNIDGYPNGDADWDELYKVTTDGTTTWARPIGSTDDVISNIAIDASGSIYVAGRAYVNKIDHKYIGSDDVLLRKYDRDGSYLWRKTFGSEADEGVDDMVVTADGTVLISGMTEGSLEGNINRSWDRDLFLSRFDADGQRVWLRQYGSLDWDETAKIAIDEDGYAYMSGHTLGSFDGMPYDGRDLDIVMIKTAIGP